MPPRKQAPQPLPTTKLADESPTLSGAAVSGDSEAVNNGMEGRGERLADTALGAIGEGVVASLEPGMAGTPEHDEFHRSEQWTPAQLAAAGTGFATVQVVDGEDQFSQPVSRNENWVVVEELYDDEFQVEVANIDGYQMRKSILRFRVRGELMPVIEVMDGIRYHPTQGFQKR